MTIIFELHTFQGFKDLTVDGKDEKNRTIFLKGTEREHPTLTVMSTVHASFQFKITLRYSLC